MSTRGILAGLESDTNPEMRQEIPQDRKLRKSTQCGTCYYYYKCLSSTNLATMTGFLPQWSETRMQIMYPAISNSADKMKLTKMLPPSMVMLMPMP